MADQEKKESAGGKVAVAAVVGVVVLLGGGYAGTAAWIGDKAPRGSQVLGTEIGGLSATDARTAVMKSVSQTLADPVTLTIDGKPHRITPEKWGVSVDQDATVAAAGAEKSWSPGRVWDYFTSGGTVDPVLTVDAEVFDQQLAALNDTVGTAATDATLSFKDGKVVTTAPKNGHGVDVQAAQDAVLVAVRTGKPVAVQLTDTEPRIGQAEVQKAKDDFANAAVQGNVTVTFGDSTINLTPAQFTPAISVVTEANALVPQLDKAKLDAAIKKSPDYTSKPQDATVKWGNGKPEVVPAKPGITYDAEALDGAFLDAVRATQPAKRTISVKAVAEKAEFSTEDAQKLGIKEKVSTFTTEYPHAFSNNYRNINIGRAASLVNGTVLKPGDTFSLNGIVGERTVENGFTAGSTIANGVFKTDLGGGVSQVATTTFNAMFFAGLKDVEHRAHSIYISRYPVGREATVSWGQLDLKFTNDTDYGVLVRAYIKPSTASSSGSLTVEMWSTKVWDISTTTGPRYNVRGFTTVYDPSSSCEAATGTSGFDVNYERIFRKPGSSAVVKTEKFTTVYNPGNTIVCAPPPAPKSENKPAA